MFRLSFSPWFFIAAFILILLTSYFADRIMLDDNLRKIQKQVALQSPVKAFGIFIGLSSIRYFKHISNQNLAIVLIVAVVFLFSLLILKYLFNEIKRYDKAIFPAKYLQLKRIIAVSLFVLLLSSTLIYIDRLITDGYVPISQIDRTTPIFMLFLFVILLFSKNKGNNKDYKPIFKQDS